MAVMSSLPDNWNYGARARLSHVPGREGFGAWSEIHPASRWEYRYVKRAFDLALAGAALILAAPLMLLIALAVKCSSSGPVLFKQQRVGMGGRLFWMFKFRTMRDSSRSVSDLRWTQPNDSRVTRLGSVLRRTSLDELPQLCNVLKGEMSLVGPRPERPHFVESFECSFPDYGLRHTVRGGITGWAQVNGWRGDTSIGKRLEHDLYYVHNWTVGFDLKILLITLTRGFNHPNAC